MSRLKKETILENLTVQSVAAEGKCIAHTPEGQVVFIEYAVPGDVVDVRVTVKKKNYLEGRIVRLVEPSPDRLEPFCEHFGVCGGCRWQLLPYRMQLEAKQRQVFDQLSRIGHLELPEISPIIPSDKTEFYRNKLEFTASDKRWILPGETTAETTSGPDSAGTPDSDTTRALTGGTAGTPVDGTTRLLTGDTAAEPPIQTPAEAFGNIPADRRQGLGFHVGKFFDKVLDIHKCYLQRDPSNDIRLFIREYAVGHGIPFYNIRENRGIFRNMFVRTTDDGKVMLILCFAADFDGREAMLDAVAQRFPQITSLYYVINDKFNDSIADRECILYRGEEAIYETMEGLRFKIGPKSFYQTNNAQALKLYRTAREFASLSGTETVYDLYTGTGTIAQFVSSRAAKVIGVEYVPEAIEDAKANAAGNGITNCSFFAGDMKDILTPEFIAEHGRPDVIITDPPRAGMHPDVIKTIMQAAPQRIVYVSCNPASQARDLQALSGMYRITDVQPVDMFPHTQHVENVCRLTLREGQ